MSSLDPKSRKVLIREASRILLQTADESQSAQEDALRSWAGEDNARQEAADRALRIWDASSEQKSRRRTRPGLGTLMIIGLLAAFLYPAIRLEILADFKSGRTMISGIDIAAGVVADLDAGTALAVDQSKVQVTVKILEGSAYFYVTSESDRTVDVTADNVTARVTGTEFAVENGAGWLAVAVNEGSVTMRRDDVKLADLKVGFMWRRDETNPVGQVSRIQNADAVAAWRSGWLDAEDLTMRDIASILDRRYAGKIIFGSSSAAEKRVTGRYRLDDPIGALQSVAAAHGYRVVQATPWIALVTSP
ncbi:MAG: FecR domain-containing protein [Pseudomonadota bacterium]